MERTFLYGRHIPAGYTLFYPVDEAFDDIKRMLHFDLTTLFGDQYLLNMLKETTLSRDPNAFKGVSGLFKNLAGDGFMVNFEEGWLGSSTQIVSNEVIDGVRYVGIDRLLITQETYWKLRKSIKRINPVPISLDAKISDVFKQKACARHQCRGFYKASKNQLEMLRANDFFTWLSIHSYMMSPIINIMLFEVNGDWTKFNQTFSDVVKTRYRIRKYSNERSPYNIFNTFYKGLLIEGGENGKYLGDRSGEHIVESYNDLVKYYPEMKPYLTMRDKAEFTLAYAISLNNAILSIPRLLNSLDTYRGYTPLNIPDTLTLNVDDMNIGQEITNWGFMSISLNKGLSAMFADAKQSCCMLKVILPPDTPAFLIQSSVDDPNFPKSLAPFDDEEELLLPVGIVLRITKKPGMKSYTTRDGKSIQLKTAHATVVGRKTPTY
tara:strand:- start:86440 stop:87744 length:1305 start_codon:yes stop_codon:yes gene_type:complete